MVILQHRRKAFRFSGPPPPPATSYSNAGGSGDRTGTISITRSMISMPVSESYLIDGITAYGSAYFGSGTSDGDWFYFNFGSSKIIDEVKWYQQTSHSHGTWKIQGSSDASSWTDIGTSFTLGGSTAHTITEINGNTTAYQYYRFYLITGPVSSFPYLYEIEFKLRSP